jgi:leader peptidase (prepilin peptidase) / N-methyltransferase
VLALLITILVGLFVGSFLTSVIDRSVNASESVFLIRCITAMLFAMMAIHFGGGVTVAAFCVLMSGLLVLTFIDLRTHRLPREVTYIVMAIGAVLLSVAAIVDDQPRRMYMAAFGAVISVSVMSVLYLLSRGGLGDGDVRMSPLLGMYLGWLNPGLALVGLLYGFILAALVSAMLMIFGTANRRTAIAFGPFLALGTLATILHGQVLIEMVRPS